MSMASVGKLREVNGRKVFVLNAGVIAVGTKDQYKVIGSRGHGGFAYAYLVQSLRTGMFGILKMSSAVKKNDIGGERIRREAFVLNRCYATGKGLLPKLIDQGTIDGRPFFVMENLQKLNWSQEETGLPNTDAGERRSLFFRFLIDCLEAVHNAGFVHCDIKPSNIMERADTHRPVLIDFGTAHPIVNDAVWCTKMPTGWKGLTQEAGCAFTLGYDADEDAYTIQKDIFALGQVMRDSFGKEVDLAWAEIINKCISRRRELRYETLHDLRSDVENINKRRRAIYWNLRMDRIREQREIERSLSAAVPETAVRDAVLKVDDSRSVPGLTVLRIEFPKSERKHYVVCEPIALKENTILTISGRGILEANISGPPSSAVVLRDYATVHNTDTGLPPENDLTYVVVGPGSYLNFPNLRESDYRAFFPNRRRILRDIDATTSFRFGGPRTFSGVEEESLAAIAESAMPQSYKDVLMKFFTGEDFTVLPKKILEL